MAQIEFFGAPEVDENNKYTKKIGAPQYLPSKTQPLLSELSSSKKYSELVRDIVASSVTDEEKDFLLAAATRHIVFNYAKIADYYAHATPEMQRLMENSALVIIDFNDAIANGYVKLSEKVRQIMNESGQDTDE